ncbi:MAG: hypothetical protein U1C48_08460 [Methylotenera sp.]|nr:hypothetical protein [Methylotenera sp.]
MDRAEIYQIINNAKKTLLPSHQNAASIKTKVTDKAGKQYLKCAQRIFGINSETNQLVLPDDANIVINIIKQVRKKSTLRMYARSVRHVAMYNLYTLLKEADSAQRDKNWSKVEKIVSHPNFTVLITLSEMLPSSYTENWQAEAPRKGKKSSLLRLPEDWREQMFAISSGQFTIPMLVCMLSGCRPAELEKGVIIKLDKSSLYIHISGAKVKENAGQEFRVFKLTEHPLTKELINSLDFNDRNEALVKVDNGNSVTTHMRKLGKSIWPRRKESITVYTARHAMAAACKQAIFQGADPDLVSQVLGHIVDKTATYYGNRFQSSGISVAPTTVKVPKPIRQKAHARSQVRRADGKMPSQKIKRTMRSVP